MPRPLDPRALALCLLAIVTPSFARQPAAELSPVEFFEMRATARRHLVERQFSAARPLLQRLHRARPEDGQLEYWLGLALERSGQRAEALPHLRAAYEAGFGSAARSARTIAEIHASRGEADLALDWLRHALAAGLDDRAALQTDEAFASLRGDERFRQLAGFLPEREWSRIEGWRHDLDFFVEEARRLHAAPSRIVHQPEFEAAVEALKARVAELTDTELAAELQKIVAGLGDGHSVLYPFPTERVGFQYLPLALYFFSDGLFVVDATDPSLVPLVGRKVVAMGGKSTDDILRDLEPYVSRDNRYGLVGIGTRYLAVMDLLQAMGYTASPDALVFTLRDGDGGVGEVTVPAGAPVHGDGLRPPRGVQPPLWLRNAADAYWHTPLPELDAVYVQFNQVRDKPDGPSISDYAKRLQRDLSEAGAHNLILDLRHNSGGNNFLIWPIVRLLVRHELAREENRVYVVTGRGTFSACQNLLNFIDRVTDRPIYVGEPSSSKPNFTGEDTKVRLPYTGLQLSISSLYWQDSYPGDERPYIAVAMPVDLSSSDYFSGRDPVMAALEELLRAD